jgi:hypothetical protein
MHIQNTKWVGPKPIFKGLNIGLPMYTQMPNGVFKRKIKGLSIGLPMHIQDAKMEHVIGYGSWHHELIRTA